MTYDLQLYACGECMDPQLRDLMREKLEGGKYNGANVLWAEASCRGNCGSGNRITVIKPDGSEVEYGMTLKVGDGFQILPIGLDPLATLVKQHLSK